MPALSEWRQVVAVLMIVVGFSISNLLSFIPESKFLRTASAMRFLRPASPYLADSSILVAIGMALTSGTAVNLAADRIARVGGRSRLRRPKRALVALSLQFGLGSILVAILAL